MIGTIIALALVTAALVLALREYLSGRRRDWPLLALGVVIGLITVSIAAWDWLADIGKSGDRASAVAMFVFVVWMTIVGWDYLRPRF